MTSCLPTTMIRFIRGSFVVLVVLALAGVIGCGGSEASTENAQAASDTTKAMTDTTAAKVDSAAMAAAAQSEMMQKEVDELKTDNIQLQNKLSAEEQANKDLTAKVSDLEAAQAAAQEQAAKAMAAKSKKHMWMKPGEASSSEEVQKYEDAVALANGRKFQEAIDAFQQLLDGGIKSDYADNCHYWMGLSYFGEKNFPSALEQFNHVLEFKVSEKKDDAQFMIARCYDRMGKHDQAQAEYKKLIDLYPNSEYVRDAEAKLK
jgi:TolA-binding protein